MSRITADQKPREVRRVAFVYLPTDFSDANRLYEAFQRRPPLGLQYLQATLHRAGIATELFDGVLEPLPVAGILARLRDRFDLAGFYVSSMNRNRVQAALRHLRQGTDLPLVAGGPGSIHAPELLAAGADAVCTGEGEEVLLEMVSSLREGKGWAGVRGIALAGDGGAVYTPPRPLIEDLDTLPFPCRDPATVREYYDFFNPMVRKPCITLTASRGCYYRCSYCYSHRFWRGRYRLRSVGNVLEEVREARRRFSARYLLFVDDVFPQKPAWAESFLQEFRREGLGLPWMCILNPNSYQQDRPHYYRMLREAGCNMISFGAQSAVPEILRGVHRRPEEARQLADAVKTANRLGMATVVTYIFGLPGETRETAAATTRHLLSLKADLMDAHVLEVLPGTEIAEEYRDRPVTALTHPELEVLRRQAFRSFYFNPGNVGRILWRILSKNPEWFLLFPFRPVWAALRRKRA